MFECSVASTHWFGLWYIWHYLEQNLPLSCDSPFNIWKHFSYFFLVFFSLGILSPLPSTVPSPSYSISHAHFSPPLSTQREPRGQTWTRCSRCGVVQADSGRVTALSMDDTKIYYRRLRYFWSYNIHLIWH